MTCSRLRQSSNASSSKSVTESGITAEISPLHSWKAKRSILVTESGMIIDVSPLHPEKALAPILVI